MQLLAHPVCQARWVFSSVPYMPQRPWALQSSVSWVVLALHLQAGGRVWLCELVVYAPMRQMQCNTWGRRAHSTCFSNPSGKVALHAVRTQAAQIHIQSCECHWRKPEIGYTISARPGYACQTCAFA